MRAIVLTADGLEFQPDRPAPVVNAGCCRVRVHLAGVCETDLQLMRGYMGFRGVLGHEFVGVAVDGPFAGKRVVGEINCACGSCSLCGRGLPRHCSQRTVLGILNHDGAFADELALPVKNLLPVPDSMPDRVAVFTEPVAAAFEILEQIPDVSGRKTIVLGDGRLGTLCALVLKTAGANVAVVGKHANKRARIAGFGLPTIAAGEQSPDHSADLVVDCTGSETGLAAALQWVRPCGTVVLKTTIAGDHKLSLAAIVIDEITLLGSRCGPFDRALRALETGELPVEEMIAAEFPLTDGITAIQAATQPGVHKVLIRVAD